MPRPCATAMPVVMLFEKNSSSTAMASGFNCAMSASMSCSICTRRRASGSPEPKTASNSFTDVAANAYYCKAVLWAVENGITGGTGNGLFSPDSTCTRGQSVAFLHRSAGSPAASGSSFSDVSASSYYASSVQWAVKNGITQGTSEKTFSPDTACNRAQIVTFLYRHYK